MEYKITKVRKYGKGLYQSEKIGNQWYNVVYARLYPYPNNKSTYYKVHFINLENIRLYRVNKRLNLEIYENK